MKYGEIEILNLRERPRYAIKPGEFVVLGRSPSADIILKKDQTVSRFHCKIFYYERQFWIENKSTQNTIVNGRIISQKQPLQAGDIIKIGDYQIGFRLLDMADAVTSNEPFVAVKRSDKLTAKIAVRLGCLTQAQVKHAVNRQAEIAQEGPYYPLDDILISENYLSLQDLSRIQEYRNNIPYRIPNYDLKELIGMGGAGQVYIARSLARNELVACKIFVVPPGSQHERQLREQFLNEAAVLLQFHHPNIVAGIESGDVNNTPYIIMEYVDGPTLQQYLKDQGGRLLPEAALKIAFQIAQALEHAFQHGKVHRDIKPENILLTQDQVAKLCDFGLARDTNVQSQEESVFGTLSYMSPEQIQGQINVDIRSDIYSLGGVFYRLLFGKLPFQRDSKRVRQHQYEPENLQFPVSNAISQKKNLTDIIRKMMAWNPQQRYQNPREVMVALSQVCAQFNQNDCDVVPTEEIQIADPQSISLKTDTTRETSDDISYSKNEILVVQPPRSGTDSSRIIPNTKSRQAGKDSTKEHKRKNIDATLERPTFRESNVSKKFFTPKISYTNCKRIIFAVLGLLTLISISIIIYLLATQESRLLNKFWNAAKNNQLETAETTAQILIQKYPQSLHNIEIQEQLQKMLWDEAYNKPIENRLEHALPLCKKIYTIAPESPMAQKAKLWLQQLEEEETKKKELQFLESQLTELQQLIIEQKLDKAQNLWSELESRLVHSELKIRALDVQKKLQEEILRLKIQPCHFYSNDELGVLRCKDEEKEQPYKDAVSFLVYSRGILAQPLKTTGYFISSSQGVCHCLSANDGRILWSIELPGTGRYCFAWCNSQNQEVGETRLASRVLLSRLGSQGIQLVNPADGKTLWRKLLDSPITAPPSILNGEFFVPCANRYCYRITLSGKFQGGFLTNEVITYQPTLSQQCLYLATPDYAYEFDLHSGNLVGFLRWTGKAIGSILLDDNGLFITASQQGQTLLQKFTSSDNSLSTNSATLLRAPDRTTPIAMPITGFSSFTTKTHLWLFSNTAWLLLDPESESFQQLQLPSPNQWSPLLMLPQHKEIIIFCKGIYNYKNIADNTTGYFPKLQNNLPKLNLPGEPSEWQIAGDTYAIETYQDQESWLHVFSFSANHKQLLWQRRLPGAITNILPIERYHTLWLTHHDGGLSQAIVSPKSFYPSLKIQRGWLTENIVSFLLQIPQDTTRIAVIRNKGGSQLLKYTGEVIKDWNLRENLEHLTINPIQILGKNLFIPLDKKILSVSLVSGRPIGDSITTSHPLTSPLVYNASYIVGGDASNNLLVWQVMTKGNQISLSKAWSFSCIGSIHSAPTITFKAVYVGDSAGRLYCLQLQNGKKLWEYVADGSINSILVDTTAYFGTQQGHCYALSADTGKVKWQQDIQHEIVAKPILGKKKLYWATKNAVIAMNPQNGNILWTRPTRGEISPSAWCLMENRLYIGTKTGFLHIISDTP